MSRKQWQILGVGLLALIGWVAFFPCLRDGQGGRGGAWVESANNLGQIGKALRYYHKIYGELPPAGVHKGYVEEFRLRHSGELPPAVKRGKDGQALLSWRVWLLPFLEQGNLFNQFNLDEPWDSPQALHVFARLHGKSGTCKKKAQLFSRAFVFTL